MAIKEAQAPKAKKPKEKIQYPKTARRLLEEFKKWIPFIILAIIFGLVWQSTRVAINDVLGRALDFILDDNGIDPYDAIWIIVGLALIKGISTVISTYSTARTKNHGIFSFGSKVVNHIKRLPMTFIERYSTGDFVSRVNNDIGNIREFIGNQAVVIFESTVTSIVIIAYFIYKNVLLGIIVAVVMVIVLPLLDKAIKNLQHLQKSALVKKADSASKASDILQGIRETKAFNARDKVIEEYNAKVIKERDADIAANIKEGNGFLFAQLSSEIPSFIVLGLGGWLVLQDKITIGSIFALNASLMLLKSNIFGVFYGLTTWKKAAAAASRIFDISDKENEYTEWEKNQPDNKKTALKDSDIVYSFRNVSFSYAANKVEINEDGTNVEIESETKMVLKNINLNIKKGETIAFVGRSGCGKTTLLKLMAGFYKITEGCIIKNGVDITDMKIDDIRSDLAMVSQDSYLFPLTVHNNISYGKGFGLEKSTGTDDNNEIFPENDITDAAKAANIHDFIENQSKKYESLVGERGIKLSGGQRQRIAIARAVIKDTDILLLDEPTSALDTESEYIVQTAFNKLMKDKTSIIVAHRLSGIKNADRIYVIDKGEIVEQGTHESLISSQKLYYELYQRQLQEQEMAVNE